MDQFAQHVQRIRGNIGGAILGKDHAITMAMVGLFSRGHVLIEDVPGVGKTTLARALAASVGASFQRVQFTPDLLPSDILGVSVFDREGGDFEFRPGPIFANIVLADEINRATPRTQAALLEAMNDHQVTMDGVTRPLPEPFMVVATQNPLEFAGTYPLPESQLDRFFLRIRVGYPEREFERRLLHERRGEEPVDTLQPVMSVEQVLRAQTLVDRVRVDSAVVDYVLDIAENTRRCDQLRGGMSPRASLALRRASQALAILEGRDYVIPDDVKTMAPGVLAHRLHSRGGVGQNGAENVLLDILARTPPVL